MLAGTPTLADEGTCADVVDTGVEVESICSSAPPAVPLVSLEG